MIQSVISQSYNNIEYIVIDGGSTDKTIDIIKNNEHFIAYWLSERDNGIYDAMNKGTSFATGVYVGILNSDDWYHENAVSWIVQAAKSYPDVNIFHGNMCIEESSGQFAIATTSHENLLNSFNLGHPACFVKNTIYHHHKFDTRFIVNADYDFFLKQYYEGKKFRYLNKTITFFRPTGISNRPSLRATWDRYRIRKKYDGAFALKRLGTDIISHFDEWFFILGRQLDGFLLRLDSPLVIRFLGGVKKLLRNLWHLVHNLIKIGYGILK